MGPPEEGILSERLLGQLDIYLDLLLRWNERISLTAVRDTESIVRRHFGESLLLASRLQVCCPSGSSFLDFGSGAGFPGLPVQIAMPHLNVTLAESQGKKVAFLREVIRALELPTSVWTMRVEAMPKESLFNVVALRAVDRMPAAVRAASLRIIPGGRLVVFVAGGSELKRSALPGFVLVESTPIPLSQQSRIEIYEKRE